MTVPTVPHSPSNRPIFRPSYHRRSSTSYTIEQYLEEDSRDMTDHYRNGNEEGNESHADVGLGVTRSHDRLGSEASGTFSSYEPSSPPTPGNLSRSESFSDYDDQALERLTVFDLLENLALPRKLEKLQREVVRRAGRSQERLKSSSQNARTKVIEEWRKRVPTADEQLDRYRKRMRGSVDRLSKLWKDSKSVTTWEKMSFIAGVMNVFVSGYLVGAHPQLFPYWYTGQLFYFMPVRLYTYKKKGFHYFLADLCYFVNFLTLLSIYVFPQSKRLLISTYCLAFGNNAIAIAMWRNSLVFHSMDKVVSLFIHIMPCVTLHCLIHVIPPEYQKQHYPAIYTILHSDPSSPEHYTLPQMMFWASLPYAMWQLSYHLLITVRRREKIAAGRPTSYTWLRRSFANVWIGKLVLSLPEPFQEPTYMLIQYVYALLTMVPCPLWFWSRWASGLFLAAVFTWSVWNGATFYIDVFGTRFQKELDALKRDVAKWQSAAELAGVNGPGSPPVFADGDAKTPGVESTVQFGAPLTQETSPVLAILKETRSSSTPSGSNGEVGIVDKETKKGQ